MSVSTATPAANEALAPVSPDRRVFQWHDHASLWFSLGVGLLVMQVGAYLMPALGTQEALWAIAAGSILGAGLHDGVAAAQRQSACHVGAGTHAPAVDHAALGGALHAGVAGVGQQLEKTVLNMLLGMRGHEGALALAAHHEIFGRQIVDGLAYRALAHSKARSQLHLARDGLTGLPLALLKALQNQSLDLLVQRAERWRCTTRSAWRYSGVVGGERER